MWSMALLVSLPPLPPSPPPPSLSLPPSPPSLPPSLPQTAILGKALSLHGQRIDTSLQGLHEKLEGCFEEFQDMVFPGRRRPVGPIPIPGSVRCDSITVVWNQSGCFILVHLPLYMFQCCVHFPTDRLLFGKRAGEDLQWHRRWPAPSHPRLLGAGPRPLTSKRSCLIPRLSLTCPH